MGALQQGYMLEIMSDLSVVPHRPSAADSLFQFCGEGGGGTLHYPRSPVAHKGPSSNSRMVGLSRGGDKNVSTSFCFLLF